MQTVTLKIECRDEKYFCAIVQTGREPEPFGPVSIGPRDTIDVEKDATGGKQTFEIGKLVEALIRANSQDLQAAYRSNGQLALGRHLYQQTVGQVPELSSADGIDLRILTTDNHALRLPWPLMNRDGVYLTSHDIEWCISLTSSPERQGEVELPPGPKILMIAPQPAGVSPTERKRHLGEVSTLLRRHRFLRSRSGDAANVKIENLEYVETWDAFRRIVKEQEFELIYYYGHGVGDATNSSLQFETSSRGLDTRSVADFAEVLQTAKRPPEIVYVNCCQGDSGGLLGAGRQLSRVASCVITNRTLARVHAARAQAIAFLSHLLMDGYSPHKAVSQLYSSLPEIGLSREDIRWFTPVCHARYESFRSQPPPQDGDYDQHWRLSLDRRDQFGGLSYSIGLMLRDDSPRAQSFVWFGQDGQGVELFQERIRVELPRQLATRVESFSPNWPQQDPVNNRPGVEERAWEDMLLQAFDNAASLRELSGVIRRRLGNEPGLIVVDHAPIAHGLDDASRAKLTPDQLILYLKWWDQYVLRDIDDRDQHFVLTFPFVTADNDKFEGELDRAGYETVALRDIVMHALPALESVKRRDVARFLKQHGIFVRDDDLDAILDWIMARTRGVYEATVEELEQAVYEGYLHLPEERLDSDDAA